MTWSERRVVTFLSTILLILIAAVVIVLSIRYRESRSEEEVVTPTDTVVETPVDENAYVQLSYDNGTSMLSFSRENSESWSWTADKNFPLNDRTINEILLLLDNWAPQQTLTDAEALENCGLDEPKASLSATTIGGKTTSLLFGKAVTDGNGYYVRLNNDEKTVYIIDDTLYKLMEIPVYDMCILPELPELEVNTLQSIAIRGTASEEGGANPFTVLTAQRADEDPDVISWRSSGANVTDLPLIKELLKDITALSIDRCIDFNPSEEAVTLCGLDSPVTLLHIAYTGNGEDLTLDLTIGNQLPDSSGRYVRINDDTTVYFLPTELLDPLMSISVHGLEA